jgi:hypothetical protein
LSLASDRPLRPKFKLARNAAFAVFCEKASRDRSWVGPYTDPFWIDDTASTRISPVLIQALNKYHKEFERAIDRKRNQIIERMARDAQITEQEEKAETDFRSSSVQHRINKKR